jgi:hypothetical protein
VGAGRGHWHSLWVGRGRAGPLSLSPSGAGAGRGRVGALSFSPGGAGAGWGTVILSGRDGGERGHCHSLWAGRGWGGGGRGHCHSLWAGWGRGGDTVILSGWGGGEQGHCHSLRAGVRGGGGAGASGGTVILSGHGGVDVGTVILSGRAERYRHSRCGGRTGRDRASDARCCRTSSAAKTSWRWCGQPSPWTGIAPVSTWGSVAFSSQKQKHQICQRSWHEVDERQHKAAMRPSPCARLLGEDGRQRGGQEGHRRPWGRRPRGCTARIVCPALNRPLGWARAEAERSRFFSFKSREIKSCLHEGRSAHAHIPSDL